MTQMWRKERLRDLAIVGITCAVLAAAGSARADPTAYVGTGGASFGTLDLTTGAYTQVGLFGHQLAGFGLANTTLYGTGLGVPNSQLFSVNVATGVLTPIGSGTGITVYDFGSTTSGMYALDPDFNLYSIDPTTGMATLIGSTGVTRDGGYFGLSTNSGILYFSNNGYLYTLNTSTGAATLVGPTGGNTQNGALLWENGTLYGGEDSPSFAVATLDPTTGAETTGPTITGVGASYVYALAPNPIPTSPCPSSGATVTVSSGQARNFSTGTPSASPLVSAVLPTSRSVQVCATATAFATIINAGTTAASGCAIAPLGGLPLNFLYQTTDPSTNALTGTANTPVNIAAGAAQSFLIALTPTAAFNATNVNFSFACTNAAAAPTQTGLNTLLLSGSTSPVPDIVALAASGDPGIVDIPGTTGTGVFAVATVNLGADATITASANTGTSTLPVTLTICQTVPATGACMASPAATVQTDIQPNATPTFGIFVAGGGAITFDPANSRVFVQFADPSGNVRGETSVAVRTQ